ncbi:pyridoxamine 5'-phosphate oxidase family protein [Salinigranum marinum]|uniref:pyridoxamine 5'-phosphate oxidase family protein n=1 Tax=Salinigranum marinum TaxID=1515595 RepID=UPI00298A061D|nr:pyridoxamine 5'-phosphate oxidase family protein [Salinigranum marinum]
MSATATHMDADEIAAFLDTQETGVVSFADDDDSYAIPVSFASDVDDEGGAAELYFRFGFAPGSEKRAYLDASDHVSFVVYDDTAAGWKSVVARGRLEAVSARSLDAIVAEAVHGLDIPYFAVHDSPVGELHFTLVRLDATELTGIVEATPEE